MNETNDSFKTLFLWLGALFLAALGAQLWIAWLYGSPLLLWDQWYEASFVKLAVTGHLKFTDFFAGHNEHRILPTRVLDLSLIWLNGRWEPLLQMTVNAFIHAAWACGLAFCLWVFLGRKNAWLVCGLLLPFFVLPYWGENAIWGFNSQDYFVNIFALVALVGLGLSKPGGWSWWCGCLAAVLGLFNMASGLLAPLAVGGLIVLRALKNRRLDRGNLITLVICLLVVVLGAALNVTKEQDRAFQAHSLADFTAALTRNLSWPFFDAPVMPVFVCLPLAFLLAFYLRPNFPSPRAAELLLVLSLWSALQSIVLAYGRANYGGTFPVSRYMDWLNVLVIAAVFAAVLLAQLEERHPSRNGLLALAYIGIIVWGVCRLSPIVVDSLLAQTRMLNLVAEERVQNFLANGKESEFLQHPTIRPDPQLTLSVLRDPALQPILPASCLPPAFHAAPERLMPFSQWLMEHSIVILSAGLILFIGLCGFGLARDQLGLAAKAPAGFLALLVALTALGFVWSKHSVTRNAVEYQLQAQIAANFKAAGNFSRAAIHEQKAEALKP